MSNNLFSSLKGMHKDQLSNLERLGYTTMTDIQAQSLPLALAGRDVRAQAKTGSGKTAAFGIPLLNKLNPRFFGVQALVLCPTRELSTQVAEELRKLARYQPNIKIVVLTGGVSIGPQIGSLEHGAHVVVGTPGRICDHLRKETLVIDQLETLVLDEADRMLDMGFTDDIHRIATYTPNTRQTLLFSATYPDDIEKLSHELQNNPETVSVESLHTTNSIDQRFYLCGRGEKEATLMKALATFPVRQSVIFCNTKQVVMDVTAALREQGYIAHGLHGDLDQKDRDQIYVQFRQGSSNCLVATDVAARGLDVDDLPLVVNFDLPREVDVYTHRIGRTGRAGKDGIAISLTTESEAYKREAIEEKQQKDIPLIDAAELADVTTPPLRPETVSLCIGSGRKNKLRPGDILGALTSAGGIDGKSVGKIDVLDFVAYVAVARPVATQALQHLQKSRIKGKAIKVRKV